MLSFRENLYPPFPKLNENSRERNIFSKSWMGEKGLSFLSGKATIWTFPQFRLFNLFYNPYCNNHNDTQKSKVKTIRLPEAKLIPLILLFLISGVNASSVILSNTSSDYEICIYDADGLFKGCANNTNSVNFSKSDYIWQLRYFEQDIFHNPLGVMTWLPFILIILSVLVLVVLFTGGLSKVFGRII